MSSFERGKKVRIIKINIKNKKVLSRLNAIGIIPDEKVKIIKKVRGGPITILVKNKEIAISKEIAEKIYGERT